MFIFSVHAKSTSSTLSTVEDSDILSVAQNGASALHKLYEKTSTGVYSFILSIVKDKANAEDVCQETYLTVYAKAGEYIPQGKPMAWIITIAKRHALMLLRNKSKTRGTDEEMNNTPSPADEIENAEQRLLLKAALEQLDDNARQIVMLKAVSDMKAKEIAEIVGIPLNTVLSTYSRAVKKLKNYLTKEAD